LRYYDIFSWIQKGLICVWTVDARGTLTPTRQYRKKSPITNAVFCVVPIKLDNRKVADKQSYSPAFFFGTEKGLVAFADDLGHCSDVQQLSSSVDIMMFFEERSRLVIITRSLLLTQYQVAEDGKVSRVMQMKLSVAGDLKDLSEKERGLRHVVWASPGLLAAATHEKMVSWPISIVCL
jgi:intraflagellar transport protein 140